MEHPVIRKLKNATMSRCIITGTVFLLLWALIALHPGIGYTETVDWNQLEFNGKGTILETAIPVFIEISPMTFSVGDTITLRVIGRVDEKHHLYSVKQQGEFAPSPTRIMLKTRLLKADSPLTESPTKLIIDKAFDMPLQVHKHDFWISQQFRASPELKPGPFRIDGYLLYQICNHRICSIPLKSNFSEVVSISDTAESQ